MRPHVARFLSHKNWCGCWFAVTFRDEAIKWLQWVSKRWHSSFEVDHHHLSSRWIRPHLARFLSHKKWCTCWFAVTFRDEAIKWLQWVSKRWHSSFEVDHHHLSSRWMRPHVARFLSHKKWCSCWFAVTFRDEAIKWLQWVSRRWHSSFEVDHHHLSSRWMRSQVARFFPHKKWCSCWFAVTFRDEAIKWLQWVSKRCHSSFEVDHHHLSSHWMRPHVARFLSHKKWCGCWFAVTFRDEAIKWLQWVSKRWHSSFEVDHHHLSSRWMRPHVARFLSHKKWCGCWFAVTFRDEAIKWLQWVSKRWHSSFEVDHHHLSSRWMRSQVARFFPHKNDAVVDLRLLSGIKQ